MGHLTGTEYGEWTVTTDSLKLRTVLQLCILSTFFLRRCTLRNVCGEKIMYATYPLLVQEKNIHEREIEKVNGTMD